MTSSKLHTYPLYRALAHRRAFTVIVVLFVVQALWIACTGRYPMAFDEDFHLGIIRLFAHHLSPIWAAQPAHADGFGAVVRDPSYLYQYIMSFPYRLITVFTANQTVVVMILRCLNIALFAASFWVFRALLHKQHASRATIHLSLLVFALLPVVPLLAAQINYDNAFIPLTGLALLLTIRLTEAWQAHSDRWLRDALWLFSICLAGCLIKYAFLPIFAAITVYLVIVGWRIFRRGQGFWLLFKVNLIAWRKPAFIAAVVVSIILSGLWLERYGYNVVQYHTPLPDCAKVLSYDHCKAYGPWIRDYTLEHSKVSANYNPLAFLYSWFQGMWLRTFFAVDGPTTHFQTRGPLFLPGWAGVLFPVVGFAGLVYSARYIYRTYSRRVVGLFYGVCATYVGALLLDAYRSYIETGKAVAINGRYLFPVSLLLIALGILGVNHLLRQLPRVKLGMAGVLILCLLWGGGAATYILRSNDAWYWPGTPLKGANHLFQRVIGPITPGYRKPTQFLG